MDRQTILGYVQTLAGDALAERGVGGRIESFLALALLEFSRTAAPRRAELTLTGDATDEYALTTPWDDSFSTLVSVTYWPDNDTTESPQEIALTDVRVEKRLPAEGGTQIRLLGLSPAAADRVVVTFTAPHAIGDTAATTSVSDVEALGIAHLTTALIMAAAASGVAATVPQHGDGDLVASFDSRADAYRRLADHHRAQAREVLGAGGESGGAQVAISSQRAIPGRARGRRPYLTHGTPRWHG